MSAMITHLAIRFDFCFLKNEVRKVIRKPYPSENSAIEASDAAVNGKPAA